MEMDLFVWLQYTLGLFQVKNLMFGLSQRFRGMFTYFKRKGENIRYTQNKL